MRITDKGYKPMSAVFESKANEDGPTFIFDKPYVKDQPTFKKTFDVVFGGKKKRKAHYITGKVSHK